MLAFPLVKKINRSIRIIKTWNSKQNIKQYIKILKIFIEHLMKNIRFAIENY